MLGSSLKGFKEGMAEENAVEAQIDEVKHEEQ
jgi:hypothetical protein